jgi:hypothetical protein
MVNTDIIQKTKHAAERQSKRGILDQQMGLAMDFGQRFHGTGVEYCFLGRKDIPEWIDPWYAERMDGTVVILSRDGVVITTYRNRKYLPRLRKRTGVPRDSRRRGHPDGNYHS